MHEKGGEKMTSDNALDIINRISKKNQVDSNDLKILLQLSKHKEAEIRAYAAELLVLSKNNEAEKMLINMCDDEDELVRVNACDSLCVFPSKSVYICLINVVLNDDSTLVKTYAVLSIIDIMGFVDIDINKLKKILISNSDTKEINLRAACYKGLYFLGEDKYLKELLKLIYSDNYAVRCAVLNMLEDIITKNNKYKILSGLKELQKTEDSIAVNSVIKRILKDNHCLNDIL